MTLFNNDIEYDCSLCKYMMDINNSGEFSEDEFRTLNKLCEVCRLNNYDPTQHYGQVAHYSFVRKAHRFMYRVSYVYKVARNAIVSAFQMIGKPVGWGSNYKEQWRNHVSLQFRLVKLSMKLLQSEFEKANVPLLVVMYPPASRINEQNDYVRLYSDAAKFLSESTGVTVLSGYPAFFRNEQAKEDMSFSLTDGHPNCQAHEIFATWVLDKMQSRHPHAVSAFMHCCGRHCEARCEKAHGHTKYSDYLGNAGLVNWLRVELTLWARQLA